jgi:hypothetical protein
MTAVLGDFLRPARAHITAAARSGGDLSVPAKRGVIAELNRLVTTMSRYLDDVAPPDDFTPASTANPQVRAGLDARLALRRAASSLHPAATAVLEAMADNTHPAVGHLTAANDYLAAGRDLLQTHFTTGPAGEPIGSTWWAAVITSPPVTAALLSELAACSRQLGAWTAQLSRTGSLYAGLPAGASQGLRTASRSLRTAATSVPAANLLHPPATAGQMLLAAIPPGTPPPRQPPNDTEPVAELCAGITVTAERLRHAVRAFAAQARLSPAANSLSWRSHALAAAITSHTSDLILRSLAERARQLGAGSALPAQLAGGADVISLAWPAWQAVARHWDTVSTGVHHRQDISPVTAELEDLMLRTGRLAYDNPRWTPAGADTSPARNPADLAATADDIRAVLAAVHHAADAISRIAACDTDAVRDAVSGNRLYLPTRLLPEHYDIPCPYAPAPPPQAAELLGSYDTAACASLRAAITLDQIAVTTGSPSSALALARLSSGSPVTARQPADRDGSKPRIQPDLPSGVLQPQAGQVEDILRSLHITEPPQRKPRTPGDAPRTAAMDVIPAGAHPRQHLTPAGPGSGLSAGRARQQAPRNSPGHCPVT